MTYLSSCVGRVPGYGHGRGRRDHLGGLVGGGHRREGYGRHIGGGGRLVIIVCGWFAAILVGYFFFVKMAELVS